MVADNCPMSPSFVQDEPIEPAISVIMRNNDKLDSPTNSSMSDMRDCRYSSIVRWKTSRSLTLTGTNGASVADREY